MAQNGSFSTKVNRILPNGKSEWLQTSTKSEQKTEDAEILKQAI